MPFDYRQMKENVNRIYRDKPGERFRNYHLQRRIRGESAWKKSLYIAFGVLLIFGGAVLGFAPGLPGTFLAIPGLILIITRIELAARFLDAGEVKARELAKKIARCSG
jgi:hypothetical protein